MGSIFKVFGHLKVQATVGTMGWNFQGHGRFIGGTVALPHVTPHTGRYHIIPGVSPPLDRGTT
jgi:hypothetical protein